MRLITIKTGDNSYRYVDLYAAQRTAGTYKSLSLMEGDYLMEGKASYAHGPVNEWRYHDFDKGIRSLAKLEQAKRDYLKAVYSDLKEIALSYEKAGNEVVRHFQELDLSKYRSKYLDK